MEIHRALEQVAEIHTHLARGELYRGYRSIPVALSGVLAIAAAGVQPWVLPESSPMEFVGYWVVVAVFAAGAASTGIARNYMKARHAGDAFARRRTRTVVGQTIPALLIGAVLTLMIVRRKPEYIHLLPGLWSILYGLSILSARPYLPKNIGWVALFFLVAGIVILAHNISGEPLSPWSVGLPFGVGQLAGGLVLYWDLERNHERKE